MSQLETAKEAIDDLFHDTTQDLLDTKSQLEELAEHIDGLLETIHEATPADK